MRGMSRRRAEPDTWRKKYLLRALGVAPRGSTINSKKIRKEPSIAIHPMSKCGANSAVAVARICAIERRDHMGIGLLVCSHSGLVLGQEGRPLKGLSPIPRLRAGLRPAAASCGFYGSSTEETLSPPRGCGRG